MKITYVFDGELDDIDVRAIRSKLSMTQLEFASAFGISVASVRNWEQGRCQPDLSMRSYLVVIEHSPETVLKALATDEKAQLKVAN